MSDNMVTINLTQLESSGLIRLAQREPYLEYLFRHALVQEAAYDSILKSDRKRLHLAVAQEIERFYVNHLDEYSSLLGYHFREAGEKDKAGEYFSRAADYASAKFANDEAEFSLRAALELSSNEDMQANLAFKLATTLTVLGRLEEARAFFDQALPFYVKNKAFDNVAAIYAMFAQIMWGLNDMAGLLAATQEGLRAVGDQPAGKGLADLLRWAAAACVFNDMLDEATVLVHKALDVSRKANVYPALAHSLTTLGLIQDRLGQPALAIASYQQAIALAEQYNLSNPNARARNNLANILLTMGQIAEAAAQYEYMVALCQKENTIFVKIWFLAQLGLLYIQMGKTRQAVDLLLQLESDLHAIGGHTYREQYEEFLGTLRYYTSDLAQAQAVLTTLIKTTTNRQTILSASFEKAAILQLQGIYPEAVALMEKGVNESGIWGVTTEHWYLFAGGLALAGDGPGAREALLHADDMIDAQQPNFAESIERLRAEINLDLLETNYTVAIEKYQKLAERYKAAEYRWRYAQTLQDWANACLKANQRDTAKELLRQAAIEFEVMEIQATVAQIQQQLIEIDTSN